MSNPTDSYELYECPAWFQDRLTEIGGVNIYDEPNFRVVWGQGGQPECLYRAGGHWHVDGQPSFIGYRDLLLGGGTPSWCLLQWHPAVHFGTPESYYVSTHDDETGLQDLGEYPYSGRYVLLYNMCYRDMQQGKMRIEAMPLNSFVLDTVVPIILEAKDISYEKTMAAMKGLKEAEDKADTDMIEDVMRDSRLAFKGPVSYARQGCRTSLIDKKVEQMSRHWNKMVANARILGKGLSSQAEDSGLTQDLLRSHMKSGGS
jgi:hypothetical protein